MYQLDQEISKLGHPDYIPTPYLMSANLSEPISVFLVGLVLKIIGSVITLAELPGILLMVISAIWFVFSVIKVTAVNSNRRLSYERLAENARKESELDKNQRIILLQKRPEYVSRLEKARSLLNSAYEINIIPQQFRNLYAIYYLYNYLSTSQSTLESAMLHFDLQEIKSKLDIVIYQQQQIILQQAWQLAQNAKLIEQNEKLIQCAISTCRNTRHAEQYARISAVNSDVIAFTNTIMATSVMSI